MKQETYMPPRFKLPKLPAIFLIVIFTFLFIMGIQHAQLSFERIINGIGNMFHFISSAFPPNPERITSISSAMYETFQIALVGTVAGVILSLPVALLASHNTAPHPSIRWISRGAVSAMRTIPDLNLGINICYFCRARPSGWYINNYCRYDRFLRTFLF
jgi:phosphonate transport system permease protein